MKDSKSTSLLNEQCSLMVVDTLCAFYGLLSKQPPDCEIYWQSFDIAIFNEVVTNTYSYFLSGNDAGYLPDAVANKIGIYAIGISATYIGSSISITGVILAMMLIAIAASYCYGGKLSQSLKIPNKHYSKTVMYYHWQPYLMRLLVSCRYHY